MKLKNVKCPVCGKTVEVKGINEDLICPFCDAEFSIEDEIAAERHADAAKHGTRTSKKKRKSRNVPLTLLARPQSHTRTRSRSQPGG